MNVLRTMTIRALMIALAVATIAAVPTERITIKGSDTMVILVQRWTEEYPSGGKVEFQVTGGGSGTGIAALINGTTDICASSRPMKPEEVRQLADIYKYRGMEVRVARDGLSVYVHRSNQVNKLTMEQVRAIFTGKVTNWKELGGKDQPIVLYSRENNSGTYEFFKEHVLLKQDFAPQAQHMAGTAALINAISKDPNGIGFGGAGYATNAKSLTIAENPGDEYIEPDKEHILDGTYPISRFMYFFLNKRPQGTIKKFIDWVISPEGQKVVTEVGYFPITQAAETGNQKPETGNQKPETGSQKPETGNQGSEDGEPRTENR
jgi:phosphate transport system substrate-binding protein